GIRYKLVTGVQTCALPILPIHNSLQTTVCYLLITVYRYIYILRYSLLYYGMALSIKNENTERLARQVAGETGESITEAIQKSLEERWERLKARRRNRVLTGQIEDLLRRVDALPTLDDRSPDEILGYDEHGMPR